MCDPVTIGLGVSAATAALSYQQQSKMASAQQENINLQAKTNDEALAAQRTQINANAADQTSVRQRQALIERGRLTAAAGESGLNDNTGRELLSSLFTESSDIATINVNRQSAIDQSGRTGDALYRQSQSAANRIIGPSLVGTGLQVAGDYATYLSKSPSKIKTDTGT